MYVQDHELRRLLHEERTERLVRSASLARARRCRRIKTISLRALLGPARYRHVSERVPTQTPVA